MLVMKAAGDENNSLNDAVNTVCTWDELVGTILGYALSEDMEGYVREDFDAPYEQDNVESELNDWDRDEPTLFFVIGDDEDTDTEGMEVLIIPI